MPGHIWESIDQLAHIADNVCLKKSTFRPLTIIN